MTDAHHAPVQSAELPALSCVLAAIACECDDAAVDLIRLQAALSDAWPKSSKTVDAAQLVALQDLDRLTQTLSALARTADAVGKTLPAQVITAEDLRKAVGLDSVSNRLLERTSRKAPRQGAGSDHTTFF